MSHLCRYGIVTKGLASHHLNMASDSAPTLENVLTPNENIHFEGLFCNDTSKDSQRVEVYTIYDPLVMAHVLQLCGRRVLPKIAAPLIIEQSSIHSCNERRYNFRQKLHAAFIS
jgi:hypothetical protein